MKCEVWIFCSDSIFIDLIRFSSNSGSPYPVATHKLTQPTDNFRVKKNRNGKPNRENNGGGVLAEEEEEDDDDDGSGSDSDSRNKRRKRRKLNRVRNGIAQLVRNIIG